MGRQKKKTSQPFWGRIRGISAREERRGCWWRESPSCGGEGVPSLITIGDKTIVKRCTSRIYLLLSSLWKSRVNQRSDLVTCEYVDTVVWNDSLLRASRHGGAGAVGNQVWGFWNLDSWTLNSLEPAVNRKRDTASRSQNWLMELGGCHGTQRQGPNTLRGIGFWLDPRQENTK